ncbi:DUF1415 family protein [Vibrio metschnikovii]|uniref:DUF1415 family protein n=5 Tax=Bacteria TaxID=2 RepID=A0A9X0UMI9_VIBME|nr:MULTISPECIES: DUF1415 family protein [Vibrio]EKO3572464.1 DUF1415 family protein [Vibrio metschnikovii]EKO3579664.1 DUF1415 family protein [Vibrio metschnikovii]EKO3582670.1 DUF1415 family protein [Vibrio metschnikovii]EKO3607539.1 DUF1415 family protein [Vibrio metschnikovii]EKO3609432.1 DUF1415 family protein [Vibrio metschnikovii]
MSTLSPSTITEHVNQWLNDVVIGLNLCPFAAKPQRNQQIKIFVSQASREEALLQDILDQLLELDTKEAQELETTLVVVPNMLDDFMDYNFFIDWVEALIRQQDWEGIFQVATFHPHYCFAGTCPEDDENLTNRSPYPIFHLIREQSMERVLKHYPNPEAIPEINIQRVSQLSPAERKALFPYLFNQ